MQYSGQYKGKFVRLQKTEVNKVCNFSLKQQSTEDFIYRDFQYDYFCGILCDTLFPISC